MDPRQTRQDETTALLQPLKADIEQEKDERPKNNSLRYKNLPPHLLNLWEIRNAHRSLRLYLANKPFAIRVPVHNDSGKFQYSCKDSKMASPQLIFQGH